MEAQSLPPAVFALWQRESEPVFLNLPHASRLSSTENDGDGPGKILMVESPALRSRYFSGKHPAFLGAFLGDL